MYISDIFRQQLCPFLLGPVYLIKSWIPTATFLLFMVPYVIELFIFHALYMMSSLDLYSDEQQNLDNAVGLLSILVSRGRGRGREKQAQNRNPINNNRISMYVPKNRVNNIR